MLSFMSHSLYANTVKQCSPGEVNQVLGELVKYGKVTQDVARNYIKNRPVVNVNGKPMVELKSNDYFWNYLFNCNSCGTHSPARPRKGQQNCKNCSNPHENDEEFVNMNILIEKKVAVFVKDSNGVTHGYVDPKIIAVSKKDIARAESGKKGTCTQCNSSVFKVKNEQCFNCGKPYTAPKPSTTSSTQSSPTTKSTPTVAAGSNKLLIGGLVVGVPVVAGGLYWGTRTHDVEAEIINLKWNTLVTVQAFSKVTREDFYKDIPVGESRMPRDGVGAFSGNDGEFGCFQKLHHKEPYSCKKTILVKESYKCGVEPKTMENGASKMVDKLCSKTVPKVVTDTCHKDIKKLYCQYNTYAWVKTRVCPNSGTFPQSMNEVKYKDCNIRASNYEREIKKNSFSLELGYEFKSKNKTKTLSLSEAEFETWIGREAALLEVNNFGIIDSFTKK